MKSLAELEAIRERAKADMAGRTEGGRKVVVGMATCGIAAGARSVMNVLVEEVRTRQLKDVAVTMTGCIGVCRWSRSLRLLNRTVNALLMSKWMRPKARRVVVEHLVNGRVCQDLTIGAAEAED